MWEKGARIYGTLGVHNNLRGKTMYIWYSGVPNNFPCWC